MPFVNPSIPNLADFTTFVQTNMGIGVAYLPADSEWLANAFAVAMDIVNDDLSQVNGLIYSLAVYNLAGDLLVNFAQDVEGSTFFAYLREKYYINAFAGGVTASTSDSGTSTSLDVTTAMKDLTLMQLQNLKTPWGRRYLGFAQTYGPTIWGLT